MRKCKCIKYSICRYTTKDDGNNKMVAMMLIFCSYFALILGKNVVKGKIGCKLNLEIHADEMKMDSVKNFLLHL